LVGGPNEVVESLLVEILPALVGYQVACLKQRGVAKDVAHFRRCGDIQKGAAAPFMATFDSLHDVVQDVPETSLGRSGVEAVVRYSSASSAASEEGNAPRDLGCLRSLLPIDGFGVQGFDGNDGSQGSESGIDGP
jgi:hypothetical protein